MNKHNSLKNKIYICPFSFYVENFYPFYSDIIEVKQERVYVNLTLNNRRDVKFMEKYFRLLQEMAENEKQSTKE